MIKINLLESVTERPQGGMAAVEEVSSPRNQTVLMAVAVGVLFLVSCGYFYWSNVSARAAAQRDLEKQQEIAKQMSAIKKEQDDLEAKTKEIDSRVEAIQKLRASQKGPVAVLRELSDRIGGSQGLYLEKVEQKGDSLTISGNSPNEDVVTQFGRSLEFSGGLFTNLSIETQRKAIDGKGDAKATGGAELQTVAFIIKCAYVPTSANTGAESAPVNGAPPPAPGAQPPATQPKPSASSGASTSAARNRLTNPRSDAPVVSQVTRREEN